MRIIFALLVLFFSVPAFAADKLLDIQEVTSPGGVKAWLVEDHNVPVITMNFGFRDAGSALDPADKQGLAQMLSNTMDEGAGPLDSQAFQQELRDLSISLSFGASRDDFTGQVKTLTQNKTRAFELLTLALTQPRFDEEPVARMRASNQSRVRSALSDPDWISARILNDTAFQGHVYAKNSGGTLTSLEKIGPAELRAFHKSNIGKNNVVVAVAGDMTKEELSAALDQIFGTLPTVTIPQTITDIDVQNQGRVTLFKKEMPQTIMAILQPGIKREDPDYQTAQVMNFILGSSGFGSRLMEEVREKRGLTYGIYSSFMDMRHFEGLQVSTSTENKNVKEILGLVNAEWDRMKNTDITAKELEDAKAYMIGSLPLSLTSTESIASLLLALQMNNRPIDYLEQRQEKILKTTPADVKRVANRLLDTKKMTTVLVGSPEGIENATLVEKIPNAE